MTMASVYLAPCNKLMHPVNNLLPKPAIRNRSKRSAAKRHSGRNWKKPTGSIGRRQNRCRELKPIGWRFGRNWRTPVSSIRRRQNRCRGSRPTGMSYAALWRKQGSSNGNVKPAATASWKDWKQNGPRLRCAPGIPLRRPSAWRRTATPFPFNSAPSRRSSVAAKKNSGRNGMPESRPSANSKRRALRCENPPRRVKTLQPRFGSIGTGSIAN